MVLYVTFSVSVRRWVAARTYELMPVPELDSNLHIATVATMSVRAPKPLAKPKNSLTAELSEASILSVAVNASPRNDDAGPPIRYGGRQT